jgi:hypothetical protein
MYASRGATTPTSVGNRSTAISKSRSSPIQPQVSSWAMCFTGEPLVQRHWLLSVDGNRVLVPTPIARKNTEPPT